MLKRRIARCAGAAMLEFHVVALFALLPMCLGTLQMGLLLVDNHHLDLAAFHATRQSAMHHGDLDIARRAFAQAATPLFVEAGTQTGSANVAVRVASAYARAMADQALHARFRLLAPDAAAQEDHALQRDGRRVIPNDGLQYRSTAVGRRSGLSVQQANVLRIEISYCRPLVVPFARELLLATLRRLDADPWHQYCYGTGRVPVRSEGASPMQSDFRVTS